MDREGNVGYIIIGYINQPTIMNVNVPRLMERGRGAIDYSIHFTCLQPSNKQCFFTFFLNIDLYQWQYPIR